jgi:hypothetical protein
MQSDSLWWCLKAEHPTNEVVSPKSEIQSHSEQRAPCQNLQRIAELSKKKKAHENNYISDSQKYGTNDTSMTLRERISKRFPSANVLKAIFTGLLVLIGGGGIWVTNKALVVEQRAFVYCKEVAVGGKMLNGDAKIMTLQFANGGATAARRTEVKLGLKAVTPFPPSNWMPRDEDLVENQADQHLNLIPGGGTASIVAPFPKAEVDAMRAFTGTIVVAGTITYCDIFKNAHMTHFCEIYNGLGVDADTHKETYSFGICLRRNCDDDDCPEYQHDNSSCR